MIKIKVSRERGDPIKFLTEIRQRLECIDAINHPLNSKQFQQFSEQRNALDIKAQDGVAEIL
jgi:hypothetical protein